MKCCRDGVYTSRRSDLGRVDEHVLTVRAVLARRDSCPSQPEGICYGGVTRRVIDCDHFHEQIVRAHCVRKLIDQRVAARKSSGAATIPVYRWYPVQIVLDL